MHEVLALGCVQGCRARVGFQTRLGRQCTRFTVAGAGSDCALRYMDCGPSANGTVAYRDDAILVGGTAGRGGGPRAGLLKQAHYSL